jgi:hypothetical protein
MPRNPAPDQFQDSREGVQLGNGLLLNIGHKSTLLSRVRVITKDARIILNGK